MKEEDAIHLGIKYDIDEQPTCTVNIRLSGVKEEVNLDLAQKVIEVAADFGVQIDKSDINWKVTQVYKYWYYNASHTERTECDTSFRGKQTDKEIGIPQTFKAYIVENKVDLQKFVGNRFNILFENKTASFHQKQNTLFIGAL